MELVENKTFDQERALYGTRDLLVRHCQFDGPADGESALKECRDITVQDCFFNLRYPFWHDHKLTIAGCELTPLCRAALWYTEHAEIRDSKLHGIKAVRECGDIKISRCDILSPEFGWSTRGMQMEDTHVESEYFMMRSDHVYLDKVDFKGKYSFQYVQDMVIEHCVLDTKDAFWHAQNVIIRNSVVKGEYLGWYSDNVTFENCLIQGTQPLCYCTNLKLVNCRMGGCDLSFERSQVEATLSESPASIKNPLSGTITIPAETEVIRDIPGADGEIRVQGAK
ncbi:DUF3737 family protein [Faecalibaculum rodentium]|jgi:hypothetical protein|uniref:DUF3737 family protein n=1 Tax=Faecalibaculum rodentium TaxID=1702221 RepID=UPI001C3CD53D|nr:DUF3737 family protein [Faecalibaculum rodentium]